jgi:CHAT domain-containing protein
MAVSRPSTAIFAGTAASSSWIPKGTPNLLVKIHQAREASDYPSVERLCRDAAAQAVSHSDRSSAAKFLDCAGTAQFLRFQYRGALAAYYEARKLAESSGDREETGAIFFNLSSLYQQVWDTKSALRSAEEGLAVTQNLPNLHYKAELLLQLGRLQSGIQPGTANAYLRQGIEAARERGDPTLQATGLEVLGDFLSSSKNLDGAEAAYLQAYQLRLASTPSAIGISQGRLGGLKLARALAARVEQKAALLNEAERLTQDAIQLQADPRKPSLPAYVLHHQLGLIRYQQGNIESALSNLRAAIYETEESREHFPPASSSFEGANAGLEENIFDAFVEAAGATAITSQSHLLARESFLAAEVNRAASLRQNIGIAEVWRKKLPAEYWEILAQLRSEDAKLVASSRPHSPLSDRLELRLSEMEARAGLDFSPEKFEKVDDFGSLKHILEGLRETEVLLSFHLGERQSFLWTVTRDSLRLYPLASRNRVRHSIKEFRDAVQSGAPEAVKLGRQLYHDLFGQLGEERKKAAWLLSLDDALFELPFAALVPGPEPVAGHSVATRSNQTMYLIETHSLQIVPGAFHLKQASAKPASRGRLVAVGDPIYNTADPRWLAAPRKAIFDFWTSREASSQLNRLVGSAGEAEAVSRAWGSAPTTVLEGKEAGREHLLEALSPAPEVIHLATHVLADPLSGRKSFIALGLGPDRQPELLSQSDIGVLHVPNTLVVMTGCATAAGNILAGAGLQGLTEAWAVAGARGVVATQWPARDLSGDFLPDFYAALESSSTADALRKAQVEMIHSGTAYAAASTWASYQLFGGTR